MKLLRFAAVAALLVALFMPVTAQAQIILNTTTLSAALTATQNTFVVLSTANITVNAGPASPWKLFIPSTGEVMDVQAIPQSGTVRVRRGTEGTFALSAASGATVLIVFGDGFTQQDMGGSCTRGAGYAKYSPLINPTNGNMWVCRSSLWQMGNTRVYTYNTLPPFTP